MQGFMASVYRYYVPRFPDQFYQRLDKLDITKLSADQQASLTFVLEKLCSMASRKMME